jgi:hypothetical protein
MTTPTTPTSGEPKRGGTDVPTPVNTSREGRKVATLNDWQYQPQQPHPPSSGATISAEAMKAARKLYGDAHALGENWTQEQQIEAIARSHDAFHREKVKRAIARVRELPTDGKDYNPDCAAYWNMAHAEFVRALTDDGTRGREGQP